MLGKSHKIMGAVAGTLTAEALQISLAEHTLIYTVVIGASILGSLLPDADQPHSTIGNRFFLVWLPLYIVRGIIKALSIIIKPLQKISKMLGHRGIAHWPPLWVMLGVILWYIPLVQRTLVVFIALSAGIFSHLVADFIFGGLPLGIPFTTKRIYPGIKFLTGGIMEAIVDGVGVIWLIWALYAQLGQFIR